jgi:hypothetical protein
VDAIQAVAAKDAADWPAWGHRKTAAMVRADGHQVSTSTVSRARRRHRLLLPTGTLQYQHRYRATIGDGNALAVEGDRLRHTDTTVRPHQALDERTPRAATSPSTTVISMWPLADPLLDWEVPT